MIRSGPGREVDDGQRDRELRGLLDADDVQRDEDDDDDHADDDVRRVHVEGLRRSRGVRDEERETATVTT